MPDLHIDKVDELRACFTSEHRALRLEIIIDGSWAFCHFHFLHVQEVLAM
jgi:hypothetical protein